tara:strand:- start:503 stop:637 length:135 start_codon:yes stop_codon:yes gene_type:complete
MNNGTLNTMLLKAQQMQIEDLKKEVDFFRDLCSKLSTHPKEKAK